MGTIFILEDLFCRMMSHPAILPHIGNPDREQAKKIYNPRTSDAVKLLIAKPFEERIQPTDQARYAYALSLSKVAFQFIVLHEFSHLHFGHIHYVKIYSKDLLIVEDNNVDYKTLTELNYQTLEMDADANGLSQCLRYLLDLGAHRDFILSKDFAPFFKTPEDVIFKMSFAIQSVFSLYDSNDYQPELFNKFSHPPIGIRQAHKDHYLVQILELIYLGDNIEKLWEAVMEGSGKCMEAFNLISETKVSYKNYFNAMEQQFDKDHLDTILLNWKKIRPELSKYTRGKLSP